MSLFCSHCNAAFEDTDELNQHKQLVHYSAASFTLIHKSHKSNNSDDDDDETAWSQGRYIKSFPPNAVTSVNAAFSESVKAEILSLVDQLAAKTGGVKIGLGITAQAGENHKGSVSALHTRQLYVPSQVEFLHNDEYGLDKLNEMLVDLNTVAQEQNTNRGSGASVIGVDCINLKFNKVLGLRGGRWMPYPKDFTHKRSILNIENNDQLCLLYCIIADIFEHEVPAHLVKLNKTDPRRYSDQLNKFDTNCCRFPLKGRQELVKFVTQNENLNFDISIYKVHQEDVFCTFTTKKKGLPDDGRHHVRLLEYGGYSLQTGADGELCQSYTSHYALITDFNSFTRKHYTSYSKTGQKMTGTDHKDVCPSCDVFKTRTKSKMAEHRRSCDENGEGQIYDVPQKGKLQFEKQKARFVPPLRGTADFETTVRK